MIGYLLDHQQFISLAYDLNSQICKKNRRQNISIDENNITKLCERTAPLQDGVFSECGGADCRLDCFSGDYDAGSI